MRDHPVARPLPTRDTANTRKMHITIVSRIRNHYAKLQVVEDSTCLELCGSCVWRNIISAIKQKSMDWAKNKGSIGRYINTCHILYTLENG